MNRAVIALGANLGRREETIAAALALIAERVGQIKKQSAIIETAPLVLPGTDADAIPPYLNGAALVESVLTAEEILGELLEIERELGRDRTTENSRWMSRIIDLDLICVEQQIIDSEQLRLPHSEMHKRDFVLIPMAEIWPDWNHPLIGLSVTNLLARLEKS